MRTNDEIKKSILDEFDVLIQEAEQHTSSDAHQIQGPDWITEDWECQICMKNEKFLVWKAKVVNLLDKVLPEQSTNRKQISKLAKSNLQGDAFILAKALLKSTRYDFQNNQFEAICHQVASAMSIGYLEQAKMLMVGGNENSYIQAAILAGAVLESHLGVLCKSAKPPIKTKKDNGRPKDMTVVIDCLCQLNIINERCKKHLKAWCDICDTAHYRPEDITKERICAMIKGICDFICGKFVR